MRFTGGLPETRCGGGSTLRNTKEIRRALPALLKRLGVESLLDAPCGDFNWMAHTDISAIHYVGVDSCCDNLSAARAKESRLGFAPKSRWFLHLDILGEDLPAADAILCRDFLQHFPTRMAFAALKRLMATPSKWLMLTSHAVEENADIETVGDFRPLNLLVAPFSLPQPQFSIPDSGREILIWNMAAK